MAQGNTVRTQDDGGVRRIVQRVETTFDESVAHAAATVRDQVPAYCKPDDDELTRDLIEHLRAVFRVLLTSLAEGRPTRPADFSMTRVHAARRVRQGITLATFLQAFRVGQLTLWERVLSAARDDPQDRDAALSIVEHIMRLIEMCSAQAADAYLEAERHQLAEIDRLRRDLLEDLLARMDVSASPKQAILRAAGIESGHPLVVALARPINPITPGHALANAVAALGRGDAAAPGLTVARQNEIVGIVPVPISGLKTVIAGLERAVGELAGRGIELAVGVSMTHGTLPEVPDAYAEACCARDGLGAAPGVLALPMLDTLAYLMLRADDTARRLIQPQHRRFVEEDAATGGVLVETLLEYVACDLNATAAAKRMHMHVNTVYYRLERIADRSGCDLHRFVELQELVVAVRLLRKVMPAPS
jgi:PucR C-terminal helix-turn-helix domain/GGDEF-like domain